MQKTEKSYNNNNNNSLEFKFKDFPVNFTMIKVFLFVLLLTCVYTYMLKSIKDNNDTNFQKLPDNFDFELNGIQIVKPNLKMANMPGLLKFLGIVFGTGFVSKMQNYKIDFEEWEQLFTIDLQYKLKD